MASERPRSGLGRASDGSSHLLISQRIKLQNDYEIYFANGGDRTTDNVPEMDTCRKLDITMLWGIGGGKIQSSSWLINGGKDE